MAPARTAPLRARSASLSSSQAATAMPAAIAMGMPPTSMILSLIRMTPPTDWRASCPPAVAGLLRRRPPLPPFLFRPDMMFRDRGRARNRRLLAVRLEGVAEPAHCADEAWVGRVGLDLAPDSRDAHVDGAVEGLGVARVGDIEQIFARQHAARMIGKGLEEQELRLGQGLRLPILVAQAVRVDVEPLGAEADAAPGRGLRRGDARAAPQDRADARDQLAQFARLGEIVVRAELQPDDPVDGARGGGEHDDRHVARRLELAHDRDRKSTRLNS